MVRFIRSLFLFSLLLIASCSTFPKVENSHGKSMILVLSEFQTDSIPHFGKYRFYYDDTNHFLEFSDDMKFSLSKNIAPGFHYINSYDFVYLDERGTSLPYKASIYFTTKANTITIFPVKFIIKVSIGKDGNTYQGISWKKMTDEQINECKEYIKRQKNSEGWEIFY